MFKWLGTRARRSKQGCRAAIGGVPLVHVLYDGRAVYSHNRVSMIDSHYVRFEDGSTVGTMQARVVAAAKHSIIILLPEGKKITLKPGKGYSTIPADALKRKRRR